MKKIWNLFYEKYQILIKNYPVSSIVLLFATFFLTIFCDSDMMDEELLLKIFLFDFWLFLGFFYTEGNKDTKRKWGFIVTIGVSLFLYLLINSKNNSVYEIGKRLSMTYSLVLVAMIFYQSLKNSGKKLSEYTIHLFSNVLKTSILYSILSIGLLIISEIFVSLVLNTDNYDFLLRIEILLLGLFYVPNLMIDITSDIQEKPSYFIKILVRYTLNSLIILAFIVIYLYLFRVIFFGEIPSNQIFRIIALLFICYLPIWVLNNYYEDKTFFTKINHYLPIAFIPFILLQIYALFIRINAYGVTNIRYLGVMLIIFEIIYLIFYFKKIKYENLLFVFSGMVVIIFLCPWLNMYYISSHSQFKIVNELIMKDNLTNEEKRTLSSSYEYLEDTLEGKDLIKKYLTEHEEKIQNLDIHKYDYVYEMKDIDEIDIDNYHKLYFIDYSENELMTNNMIIPYQEGEIDITMIINEYKKVYHRDSFNEYFLKHNEFIINGGKLIIQYINFNLEGDNISNLNIRGYFLK